MNIDETLAVADSHRQQKEYAKAQSLLTMLADKYPDDARVPHAIGLLAMERGKPETALDFFVRATRLDNGFAEGFKGTGDASAALGKRSEAITGYEQATSLKPDYYQAYANLGNLHLVDGKAGEAIRHFKTAIKIAPGIAELHDSLGLALSRQGQSDLAALAHRHALELNPKLATAHCHLAACLNNSGHHTDAAEHFREAVSLAPSLLIARLGLVSALIAIDQIEEAKQTLQPILERSGADSTVHRLAARIARKEKRYGDARALLERIGPVSDLPTAARLQVLRETAELHDEVGEYAEAFSSIEKAHALNNPQFDREATTGQINDLLGTHSPESYAHMSRAKNRSTVPVFVLGMPRSGKTLAQKLLALHPQIAGLDERFTINRLIDYFRMQSGRDSSPRGLADLTAGDLDAMAKNYFEIADEYLQDDGRSIRSGVRHIVSAAPSHVRNLGLIARLFPSSPIIHVNRDSLDTCLECFFKAFKSSEHAYSDDLEDLGFYYLQYQRTIAHWRDTLSIPMLEIEYEELVSDPASMQKRLIDYIDSSRTLSADTGDVSRLRLSTGRIGRWRNYETQLQPLMRVLAHGI